MTNSFIGIRDLILGLALVGAVSYAWHHAASWPRCDETKQVPAIVIVPEELPERSEDEEIAELASTSPPAPPVPDPAPPQAAEPEPAASPPRPQYASAPPVASTPLGSAEVSPAPPAQQGPPDSEPMTPLSAFLSDSEEAAFRALCAQGEALVREGLRAPEYRSRDLDETYLDSLIRMGLARVAIKSIADQRLFFFTGTFSQPGLPYLVCNEESVAQRYSERALHMEPRHAERFLCLFRRTFLPTAEDLKALCVVLLRHEIDMAITGAQAEAGKAAGIPFEKIRCTEGRMEKVRSFPFRYVVESIADDADTKIDLRVRS